MSDNCGNSFMKSGILNFVFEVIDNNILSPLFNRNWDKISKFTEAVKYMGNEPVDGQLYNISSEVNDAPRSFDVVGDVAFLAPLVTQNEVNHAAIGEKILRKKKALKICALRTGSLQNTERAPGETGIRIIAGVKRSPLITTHTEYGIKCVVDLENTFFSPRMGPERLRVCQQGTLSGKD